MEESAMKERLVELEAVVQNKEGIIKKLRIELESLRAKIQELERKLKEPVVLSKQGEARSELSDLTAADVIVEMRKRGQW